jgi:hypothetical protein
MSFLSILKTIGTHTLSGVETGTEFVAKLDPVIQAIPVYGPTAVMVLNAIVAAEKLIPADGNGAAKKSIVMTAIGANTGAPASTLATIEGVVDELVKLLNSLSAALAKIPSVEVTPAKVAA